MWKLQFYFFVLIFVESNEYEMILISSNGDLAEYEGNAMGLYQVMEKKYNKASAYKQLHTLPGRQGQFIYYLPEVGGWFVSDKLGGRKAYIRNINYDSLLPTTGWQHYHDTEWRTDYKLKIEPVRDISNITCAYVTITATGEAEWFQSNRLSVHTNRSVLIRQGCLQE